MSTKVGSIHYDLDLETQKFEKAAARVSDKAKTLGNNLKNVGKKMTMFITVPIVGAGVAALKSASDYEQLEIAFTTMLDSAEKAKKLLKELDDLAVTTPFEIGEVQNAGRSLLAYGIEAENIVDVTRQLGDVSAGLGTETFPQLIRAYGQIAAKGKLQAQEVLQLTNAGFNLAEAMGLTRQEMDELTQKGMIGFDDVAKAFENVTGEGGKFFNLMENQSTTTGGKFSNLRDEITRMARDIGKDFLPIANEMIEKFRGLLEIISNLSPQQKRILALFLVLAAVLGPLLIVTGSLVTALAAIGTVGLTIIGVIGLVAGALILLETKTGFVSTAIKWLVNAVKTAYEWFSINLLPILKQVGNIIIENLKPAWESLKEAFKTSIETLRPFFPQLKMLAKFLGAVVLGAVVVLGLALVGLVTGISYLIKWISYAINWFTKLQQTVVNSIKVVSGNILNIQKSILNIFKDAGSWLFNAGKSIIQGLINGVKQKAEELKNAVTGVLKKARDLLPFSPAKEGPFSGKGWTLYSGRSMMQGLAQGIKQKQEIPIEAMNGAMQNVKNTQSTNVYGNISIGSKSDADYFFRRLNLDQDRLGSGLSALETSGV